MREWEITLRLNESKHHEMYGLQVACGLPDKAALINEALALLGWAVEETHRGRDIASVDEAGKSYQIAKLPALKHTKRLTEAS